MSFASVDRIARRAFGVTPELEILEREQIGARSRLGVQYEELNACNRFNESLRAGDSARKNCSVYEREIARLNEQVLVNLQTEIEAARGRVAPIAPVAPATVKNGIPLQAIGLAALPVKFLLF